MLKTNGRKLRRQTGSDPTESTDLPRRTTQVKHNWRGAAGSTTVLVYGKGESHWVESFPLSPRSFMAFHQLMNPFMM